MKKILPLIAIIASASLVFGLARPPRHDHSPTPAPTRTPRPSPTPSPTPAQSQWVTGQYGVADDGTRLMFQVRTPDPAKYGPGPWRWVIAIHGGGWAQGDFKTPEHSGGDTLVDNGFIVFSINYRLTQELLPGQPGPVGWDGQWKDVQAAIAFIKADTRVIVDNGIAYGGSAGAHYAALIASQGILPGIGLSPATDLTATDGNAHFNANVAAYAPTSADKVAASPLFDISASAKPFLIISFENDDMPPSQFNEIVAATGIPITSTLLPGAGHSFKDAWPKPEVQAQVITFAINNTGGPLGKPGAPKVK